MQATQTASAAMLRRRCLPTGPGIRLRRIGFGALLRCRTPPLHRPGAAPGKKRKGRLRCREKPSHQALAAMVERLHDEAPLLPLLRVSASRHHFSAQELRKREALCLCVVSCPKTRLGATPENFGASPQCLSPSRALWDTPWKYCLSASIWIETDLTNRSGLCDSATPPKEAIEATGYALKIHYT